MWRCLDFEACRLTIEVLEVQRAEKDNDDAARASHVEGGASAPNTGARSSVRVPCCDLALPYVVHVGADTHVRQCVVGAGNLHGWPPKPFSRGVILHRDSRFDCD